MAKSGPEMRSTHMIFSLVERPFYEKVPGSVKIILQNFKNFLSSDLPLRENADCLRIVLASLFLLLNPCQYLDSEVIWYVDPIGLERINRSHKRRSRIGFKPCRRTPRILIGQRYQPVFHRVLMHIIQSRQPRFLKRQASIPKFVHDSPAGSSIHAVELYRQFAV